MKMEQTECSETLANKIQTPGNNPEERIQQSKTIPCKLLMYKPKHSPSQKYGEEVQLQRTAVVGHVEDTDLRTDDPLHSDCLEQQESLPFLL